MARHNLLFLPLVMATMLTVSNSQRGCKTVSTPGGSRRAERCIFPFRFGGKIYYSCTSLGDPDSRPWCSLRVDRFGNHVSNKGRWGHCDLRYCGNAGHEGSFGNGGGGGSHKPPFKTTRRPFVTRKPTFAPPPPPSFQDVGSGVATTNLDSNGKPCFTVSGNTPDVACRFPFKFRGKTHFSCTTISSGDGRTPWCSTRIDSSGVHMTGNWGNCDCASSGSQKPPFKTTRRPFVTRKPTFAPPPPPSSSRKPSFRPPSSGSTDPCLGEEVQAVIDVPSSGRYLPTERDFDANSVSLNRVKRQTKVISTPGKLPQSVFSVSTDLDPEAELQEFPFAALLGYADGNYKCGASLINRRYVLTAAHCLALGPPQTVTLGEHDVRKRCDCKGGVCNPRHQRIAVEESVIHPRYNSDGRNENDIALLRLSRPATLSASVLPAVLPLDEGAVARDIGVPNIGRGLSQYRATVAGWGKTEYDSDGQLMELGVVTPVLQSASFPVTRWEECFKAYEEMHNRRLDERTQLCAGSEGNDACSGDSGGALVVRPRDRRVNVHYQVGIVSFGDKRCGSGLPGVYTRLTGFMDWIRRNLRE